MENEKIKALLLDIAPTQIDFTVTQTGKQSKKVNGLYYPKTHEILLHNKNFSNDNLLVYTAIHEYTHHLLSEELVNLMGVEAIYNAKAHTQKFWAKFDGLLAEAEKKGYYKLDTASSPALQEITQKLKTALQQNGEAMRDFGKLLIEARKICEDANVRYEDYIDRILCLPRKAAQEFQQVASIPINTQVGGENMKMLSRVDNDDIRQEAENELLSGHSPVSVKQKIAQMRASSKNSPSNGDGGEVASAESREDEKLAKLRGEKARIERAIENLNRRLEIVERAIEGC